MGLILIQHDSRIFYINSISFEIKHADLILYLILKELCCVPALKCSLLSFEIGVSLDQIKQN